MTPVEAVKSAVKSTRIRPIPMTTCTTLIGLAPLVFIPGAGTELYRGVGAIVLFGLAFSTLVTRTFLPCLLVTTLDIGQFVRQRLRGHNVPSMDDP